MSNTPAVDLSSDSSIDAVKNSVIASIMSADSDVRARKTDYFNHTYAPDLVLEWPRDNVNRTVYLRTTGNPTYLLEDLALIDDRTSIVMALGALSDEAVTAMTSTDGAVHERTHEQRAMIAKPEGFSALGGQRQVAPVVGLASKALLQGGSGFVGLKEAQDFGSAIAGGFEAAQLGDVDQTRVAVETAQEFLDTSRAAQVGEFLEAIWVGSGGTGTTFPGIAELSGTLSASALSLLLDTVEISDDVFWRRVGRNLSMKMLSGLEIPSDHKNFQRLISVNAHRLKVKSARIVDAPTGEAGKALWYASKGELGLRFGATSVVFSAGRIDEISAKGVATEVSVQALARRAAAAKTTVTEVTVDSADLHVEYSTTDGTSVLSKDRVAEMGVGGGSATVSTAVALVGSSQLHLDFRTSTARGNTVSTFYLSQIAGNSIPLLRKLTESELELLNQTTGGSRELVEPPSIGSAGSPESPETEAAPSS